MKLVEQSPLFYLLSKIIFIVKTIIISFYHRFKFFFKKIDWISFCILSRKLGFVKISVLSSFFSRYDLGH